MKRFLKISIVLFLFIFIVVTISNTTYAWYVGDMIIVYYKYEDGSEAHEWEKINDLENGKLYHIDSPTITGYKPDLEYVEYLYENNGGKVFIVTYTKSDYILTINYKDDKGNIIKNPKELVYDYGDECTSITGGWDGHISSTVSYYSGAKTSLTNLPRL